jgi:Zn-dependent protease with chaperone function
MDFFERQETARRRTGLLVFYFAIAITLLVLATYAAMLAIFGHTGLTDASGERQFSFWVPDLFFYSAVGTVAIILIGSISKTLELSGGGSAVAEMLDGRLVNPNTTDPDERKLLNVVEEMAIASGVPVPHVYVMDSEASINAFAAGFSTSDAVVSVTRGALELLSRDELQGVLAHEFSHILNGDMRLNLRLIGLIFGILCLTVVGRILIRTRGRKNPLPLLGLALIVIGWAGVFFGRLIQSAVSRQREYLADASAVQFTRNPAGLANALKKIGGLGAGSGLQSAHAEEASHLFFANGVKTSSFGLMDTHPRLEERIRLLDPSFDGKFPVVAYGTRPDAAALAPPLPRYETPESFANLLKGHPARAGLGPAVIAAQTVLPNVGQPTTQHLHYAISLASAASPALMDTARDPLGASAIIYALLLNNDAGIQQQQLDTLARIASEAIRDETVRILPEVKKVVTAAQIPLVDFALSALRRFSPNQFLQFRATVKALVENHQQISLFAYMLQKVVVRHLEPSFVAVPSRPAQFWSLQPLLTDCGVLLSSIAYAGQTDPAQARTAFERGAQLLQPLAKAPIPLLPKDQCDLSQLDRALERLASAVPPVKKNVLSACVETVATDELIRDEEAELLRAVADTLACPVPPFLRSQEAA